jgi:anti-sigma regulatory factor (Ser/Thr protein kinase)
MEPVTEDIETIGFEEFAPSPECIALVRQFVGRVLESHLLPADQVFECQLIADELATNALRHAGSIFSVAVEIADTGVRIAVRDDSSDYPVRRHSSTESLGGRGLSIVSATSEEWGVESLGLGKETWADVMGPVNR